MIHNSHQPSNPFVFSNSSIPPAFQSALANSPPCVPPRPANSQSSPTISSSNSFSPSGSPLSPPEFRDLPAIKLTATRDERLLTDNLADLYSLLITMEQVEISYVRDLIDNPSYTALCGKLIAQYKTLQENLSDEFSSLESFAKQYGVTAKAAITRFRAGVPATILHADHSEASQNKGKELSVFHVVQHFITAMDSLKLNMKAVDELHPNLSDLMDSINKLRDLPQDHESRIKVRDWLMRLGSMRAHEQLSDEQARQMSFDLDSAYNAFHKFVQGHK